MASKKVEPIVSDALTRVARTGLSDQEVHDRAGLPSGWLSQARGGRYSGAAKSVRTLLRWLERFESGAKAEPAAAAPVEPVKPTPSTADAVEARTRIATAIRSAKTARGLREAAREVSLATLAGELDRQTAAVLISAIKEQRSLHREVRADRSREAVRSLMILTRDEAELLAAHRAVAAGPPLEPGQAAPPPAAAS